MTAARIAPKRDWTAVVVPVVASMLFNILGGVWFASSQSTRLATVEKDVEAIKADYVHKTETEREIGRVDKHLDKIDDKLDKLLETRMEPQK